LILSGWGEGDMALDLLRGKIYWNSSGGGIARANLNGSGAELLTTIHAFGVAVDPVGEHLFWNSSTSGGLWSANLDGTGAQLILSGWGEGDMALDTVYIPEPATLLLLVLGGLGMLMRRGI
jgi:hypothetical protein